MSGKDTPGVVAPPPLIYLAFLLAGLALDLFAPLPIRPHAVAPETFWAIGATLILAGVVLLALGAQNFMRAGTPVPTREPTRTLVTTGVHGFSRNPIYVSMFLIYLGIAAFANAFWLLILFAPLALVIRYGVVAREEAYLEGRFGDAYRAYKARVRRWI